MTSGVPLLEVDSLIAGYERTVPIVRGVCLRACGGEIVALLGPNGAGKSTLLKAIAGLVPIETGAVTLAGVDITALPAHARVRTGVAYVPQTENVFTTLSVLDNLKIAAQVVDPAVRAARIADVCRFFPDLVRQRALQAGRLSGGQRQMLAVARALVVAPRVLLLDEPSAGLSPKVVRELFARLGEIRGSGVCIVLVEQNVRAALTVADRGYVLAEGRNLREGSARELQSAGALAALHPGAIRAAPP